MPVPCTARVRAVYGGTAGTIHDLALFPQAAAAVVPGTAGGTPRVVNIKNYRYFHTGFIHMRENAPY